MSGCGCGRVGNLGGFIGEESWEKKFSQPPSNTRPGSGIGSFSGGNWDLKVTWRSCASIV